MRSNDDELTARRGSATSVEGASIDSLISMMVGSCQQYLMLHHKLMKAMVAHGPEEEDEDDLADVTFTAGDQELMDRIWGQVVSLVKELLDQMMESDDGRDAAVRFISNLLGETTDATGGDPSPAGSAEGSQNEESTHVAPSHGAAGEEPALPTWVHAVAVARFTELSILQARNNLALAAYGDDEEDTRGAQVPFTLAERERMDHLLGELTDFFFLLAHRLADTGTKSKEAWKPFMRVFLGEHADEERSSLRNLSSSIKEYMDATRDESDPKVRGS